MIRRQLPAWSPVSLAALRAGLEAAMRGGQRAEAEVRELLAGRHPHGDLLLVDSGTTALALALRAAAARAPGPVALPAYSCYDVATAAEAADVPVLLYDLEPGSLGPERRSLEGTLAQGATAVVVAHLYGLPAAGGEVAGLCRDAGALLIDDAAQAAGMEVEGRPAGSLGSLGVLSFGRGKGRTGGGGGALLAIDERGRRALEASSPAPAPGGRGWKELARAAALWLLGRPDLYGLPASLPFLRLGETVHRPPGEASRMPAAAAGVLGVTWELQEGEVRRRRRNARRLLAAMEEAAGRDPERDGRGVPPRPEVDGRVEPVRPGVDGRPGYLRLPVLAPEREVDLAHLGVMPGYPKPLSRLEGFRERCLNAGAEFPGAERLARRLHTLPTHGRLTEEDLRRLVAWLRGRSLTA